MEIVKRVQYDNGGLEVGFCYGLKVLPADEIQGEFYPAYPYAASKEVLEQFISTFKKDLEEFFVFGDRPYFSFHLYGFDTKLKERFKNKWHKKGLMIG